MRAEPDHRTPSHWQYNKWPVYTDYLRPLAISNSCHTTAPVLAHVTAQEEQDVALPRRVAQQRRHVVLVRRVDGRDQQVLRAVSTAQARQQSN